MVEITSSGAHMKTTSRSRFDFRFVPRRFGNIKMNIIFIHISVLSPNHFIFNVDFGIINWIVSKITTVSFLRILSRITIYGQIISDKVNESKKEFTTLYRTSLNQISKTNLDCMCAAGK